MPDTMYVIINAATMKSADDLRYVDLVGANTAARRMFEATDDVIDLRVMKVAPTGMRLMSNMKRLAPRKPVTKRLARKAR